MAKLPVAERFWAKVDRGGPGDCWLWVAGRNTDGYGRFKVGGRHVKAHRWAYESLVGPIPEGLEIDHLCRNPPCVNPAHMEPVVHRENLLRGDTLPAVQVARTHCPQGHPYAGDNLRVSSDGRRVCRACHRRRMAERRARRRLASSWSRL